MGGEEGSGSRNRCDTVTAVERMAGVRMSGVLVVGIDGSENAAAALEWSLTEASHRGDALRLVYCLPVPMPAASFAGTMADPVPMRDVAEGVLAAAAEKARGTDPHLSVETQLVLGQPAAGLVDASKDASLLVVGARGLDAFGSMFMGSVSMRVAAHAECPTVVIPANGHRHDPSSPVVVGVDDSPQAIAALRFAVGMARVHGTEVIAVHGTEDTSDLNLPRGVEESERAQAEARLAEVIKRADLDQELTTRVVAADPRDALLEAGENASVIVVGSRGRGGFRGMLLGSVSQSVLHGAKVPVVVIRPEQD